MALNKGYAVALFDLANEKQEQKKYHTATRLVLDVLVDNEDLIKVLNSTRLDRENKKEIIEKTFKKDVPAFMLNAMLLMIDNNSFNIAIDNFKALNKMFNDHFKIAQGTIYTTVLLPKTQVAKIEKAMEAKLKMSVELVNKIDHEIIGGIKVVIGDKVFDMTVSSQIEELTHKLMKGVN